MSASLVGSGDVYKRQPAGPFRYQIRHLRGKWRRIHPSGAPGASFEVVPMAARFQFRTPEASSAWSINVGAA
eukprot:12493783-Alexandrium_andersonii.AAC.1